MQFAQLSLILSRLHVPPTPKSIRAAAIGVEISDADGGATPGSEKQLHRAQQSFTERILDNLNSEFDGDNEAETCALLLKVSRMHPTDRLCVSQLCCRVDGCPRLSRRLIGSSAPALEP